MTVTAFGSVFLPLLLFVLLLTRAWVLPLLFVSAVMHSPSVLDVRLFGQVHGLTAFFLLGCVLLVEVGLLCMRRRAIPLGTGLRREVSIGWLIFLGFSIATAMVLPWLFDGVSVVSPLSKLGVQSGTVPLHWSISNAAQIVNALVIAGAIVWVAAHAGDAAQRRRALAGVIVALVLSTLVGLQQRLGWNGHLPLWDQFWASNPTYSQNFRTFAGPVPRVSWPFVEASYASAWFAAVAGGFLAMFLAGTYRHVALFALVVALFALANTLGTTGLLGFVAFLVIALLVAVGVALRRQGAAGGLLYRLSLLGLVCACLALAVLLVLRHYDLLENAQLAMWNVVVGSSQTLLSDLRRDANILAFKLFVESFGLGVGMGSNRASSYLATLLSTTGVVGLGMFLLALRRHMAALVLVARSSGKAPPIFFLGAMSTALLAVSIAVPDQNWPVLWVLVIGGIACMSAEREPGHAPAEEAERPGRREARDRAVEPHVKNAEAERKSNQRAGVIPEQD